MKKILLAFIMAVTAAGGAWAGPVYDLAYHVSSATMKVSGDIRVAASSSSANTPTITLSGPSGITTSKPITTSSSMTANAFYGDGSHLTGVATVIPNTFVSSVTFSSNTYTVGYSSASKFYGDGSALTGITVGVLSTTTVNGIPICGYIETGSTTPPTDFLYTDGSSLSTTTYAALFSCPEIGYKWGGSGANFNLPKWAGMFARAVDTTGTIDSEVRVIGSTETDKFQDHLHAASNLATDYGITDLGNTIQAGVGTNATFKQMSTINTDVPKVSGGNGTPRTGLETRPKNIAVARHIRYQITGTTAFSNTNLVTTTATYTAPTTFSNSVTVSSLTAYNISVTTLTVPSGSWAIVGKQYHTYASSTGVARASCYANTYPAACFCRTTGAGALVNCFPSTEATDGTTSGTPISDGDTTQANSCTCGYTAVQTVIAISECARIK